MSEYNILLLGGTGAIGASLVNVLNKKADTHVFVTSRYYHENYDNVFFLYGNARDAQWLQKVLRSRRWDAIVDFMFYETKEFESRITDLLGSTNQYIFLSSSRVYADCADSPIREDTPRLLDVSNDKEFLQLEVYALDKARQENLLINTKKNNWTIIRPYLTFGGDRLQLGVMETAGWLVPALNGRPIVFSRDMAECYTTMTSGFAVAKGIASLLMRHEAMGEVFNIVSSKSYLWEEILHWYMDAYKEVKGVLPEVFMINNWDLHLGGDDYQLKYDRLFNRSFDNRKICEFVSAETFDTVKDDLCNCAKAFIKSYVPDVSDLDPKKEFHRGVLTGKFLPIKHVKGSREKIKIVSYKLGVFKQLSFISHLLYK